MTSSTSQFFIDNFELAGFGNNEDAIVQTVKELFENALDAVQSTRVAENTGVKVEIQQHNAAQQINIIVSDNGESLSDESKVPELFAKVYLISSFWVLICAN